MRRQVYVHNLWAELLQETIVAQISIGKIKKKKNFKCRI